VFHQGAVPHEAEDECADEKVEHKNENFHESIRLVARLGNLRDHLLKVNIFFLSKL